MRDLGCTKKILSIDIIRDRVVRTLFIRQERYIKKILERLYMPNLKHVQTLLGSHFELFTEKALVSRQREVLDQ